MTASLSLEQQYAFERFKRGDNLFITGPGGTGKTRLIEHMVQHAMNTKIAHQVCAMTGCAAVLLSSCNARTLHSWSGIRLAKGPKHQIVSQVVKNKMARSTWRRTKLLIVDEVSMMSKKIFDILEEIGRATRLSTLPFGGIQVVFTGDFYQLPPVGSPAEPATEQFCFESEVWPDVFPRSHCIELKTIFRQTDPLYREILLQVRTATLSEANRRILEGRVKLPYDPSQHHGCYPTKLFPTRAKTDYLNNTMFSKLDTPEHVFTCEKRTNCRTYIETNQALSLEHISRGQSLTGQEIEYELQQLMSNSSIADTLSLKVGAMVMCTVNLDMDQGICNGSQGIVIDITNSGPTACTQVVVRFSNGIVKTIVPHFRQSEEYPILAIGQIPLCLAWALTIHKIQGATLAVADIDVGGQIFEFGQTYVALSRVQSLDGLYLTAFQSQRIRANERVRAFYAEFPAIDYAKDLAILQTPSTILENPFTSYELEEETPAVPRTQAKPYSQLSTSPPAAPRTQTVSLELFLQNKTISEIAELRGLKPSTIWDHILSRLPHPDISLDRFMTPDIQNELQEVFSKSRDMGIPVSVQWIKDNVRSTITYEQIRAFLATQQSATHVKIIRI